eukprot:Rhum_TRINITY_DN14096_c4_g1::Rhum_TRINITY_DN14096_c4_g1_i1::g.67420::m.67420/K14379/ACP5; tartrate-resistant acid phosphatase type 5
MNSTPEPAAPAAAAAAGTAAASTTTSTSTTAAAPSAGADAAETSLVFYVVGDIGFPGAGRAAVADAMRTLYDATPPAARPLFVMTTGDNLYEKVGGTKRGEADETAVFEALRAEMLSKLPLPWFFALGNHDVGEHEWAWHRRAWNEGADDRSPGEGWQFVAPAPCYSVNAAYEATQSKASEVADRVLPPGLVDVVVVNTNKYNRVARAPGAGEGGAGTGWWGTQKKWARSELKRSGARWRVCVGHHPIEYIPESMMEHVVPGIRYLPSTFMKGGPRSRLKGTSMRDVIAEGSDIYLSGHQHLMAHFKRAAEGPDDKKASCEYCVVGSSSKLEDGVGAPSDDERLSDSESSEEGGGSGSGGAGFFKRKFQKAQEILKDKVTPKVNEEKYDGVWCSRSLGFCRVTATASELRVSYFQVSLEDAATEGGGGAGGDAGTAPGVAAAAASGSSQRRMPVLALERVVHSSEPLPLGDVRS